MKRIHYIILLILLLAIAAYLFFSRSGSTLKREYSDFAVEDTASVNKIFISDYEGQNALLERQSDNTWTINGKHKVRKDGIELILKTLVRIQVREPVSKAKFETVVKELAVKSTKVEIYSGGTKPAKVYYVGHATKTHYGTNMLLEIDGEKSSVPYVTHVPGFFGYLSTRFFTDEDLWRDRTIFAINADQIASIELRFLEKPLNSFKLERLQNSFALTDINTMEKTTEINQPAVQDFFNKFNSVHFEFIDTESSEETIDSVINSPPLHQIIVQKTTGEIVELNTYYKPVTDGTINQITGEPFKYNVDRLFGWVNKEDFVLMQWPTLDEILAYKQDFMARENVEN
jgi:hypothetical protein